jgi:uncharacterized damage-inducible protein DinB
MDRTTTEDMVGATRTALHRIAALAGGLDQETWNRAFPEFGDGTIGQHARHTLDHFERFLAGLDDGLVDYDLRDRDVSVERSPALAATRAMEFADRLADEMQLHESTTPLRVRCACSVDGEAVPQDSTVGRELQFLVNHSVHHFAILAAMCRMVGLEPDQDFGIAPSTLRHRSSQGGTADCDSR